jgi:hypothetical protein
MNRTTRHSGALWLSSLGLAALATTLLGCSAEVTGPKPSVEVPAKTATTPKPLPVDPGIVCNAQLTTPVVVHGQHFSPIPIDIPKNPRLALPSLTLLHTHALDGTAADAAAVLFSGDPDKPTNLDLLSWQSQQQMTFTVNQAVKLADGTAGEIPSGVYDVKVRNPNTNEVEEPGAIAVVDKPVFTTVTPSIVCVAQQDKKLDLVGTTFLQIEGTNPTLAAAADATTPPTTFTVTDLTDCTDIKDDFVKAQYCTKGSLTLSKGALDAGYPGLTVQNPQTAACRTEETVKLRVVPPPVLEKVTPPIACVHDEDRTFTITGTDFLQIDSANPTVTIAGKDSTAGITVTGVDGCEDLPTAGPDTHQVKKCTMVNITVAKGALDPGLPEIVVTNPAQADCSVSNSVALRIVPPPTVTQVVPPLVCVDDGPRPVDVIGTDFLTIADPSAASTAPVLPAVAFDGKAIDPTAVTVDAAKDCTPLDVQGLTVLKCTKLTVTLAQNGLPAGAPKVRVTNPDPAGCFDEKPGLLTVVPGPTITSAAPPMVCAEDADRTVVFTGTGFLEVGTDLPIVKVGGVAVTTASVDGCSPVVVNGLTVQSCTSLTATVTKGAYPAGKDATIENPQPAGCVASSTTALTIPPPLAFATTPQNLCINNGVQPVTMTGTGFLQVGANAFTVAVAGTPVTPTSVGGCTDLGVDGMTVQSCTSFALSIDTGKFPLGGIQLDVGNPDPSNCSISSTTALQIV